MTKTTLNEQQSLTNETSFLASINENWETIETDSDSFLSRDGTAPNQMQADIDMNSHRILNLLDAATEQEPVTLAQFHGFQEATLGDIQATLDFVFGSTPNLFMVRGDTTWGSRAIVGDDLPTPTTQSLGGVLALSPTLGQVIGGLDVNGNLVAATQINLQSTSGIAFTVGRQAGAAQPVFTVNASTANQITGIAVTGNSAGNGVDIVAGGEANVPLRIDAAGTGTLTLNPNGTGAVLIGGISSGASTLFLARNASPTINFGSTGNVQGTLKCTGTGGFLFSNEVFGNILQLQPTTSTDTNYFNIRSASASNPPILSMVAGVADLGMTFQTKGAGGHLFASTTSVGMFQTLVNTSGGANDRWIVVQPGNSGGAITQPNIQFGGGSAATAILGLPKSALSASDTSAFVITKTVGLSTPAFRVDTNTASAITGISITSGATTTGVDMASIGDATTNWRLNASGAGTITLNNVGTGNVVIGASAAGASGVAALTIASNTSPGITFGTSGNIPGRLTSQGSGGFIFLGAAGSTIFSIDTGGGVSGIANSMICRGSVSGGGPSFIATGSDPNVAINFTSKAGGEIGFYTNSLAQRQFQIDHTASADRFLRVTGSAGGNPTISTSAGDLAISNNIIATGQIRAQNATGVSAGGSNTTGFRMYSDGLLVTAGSGAPTISAAKGSLYLRTDGSSTSTRAYINTDGGTTWTNITTAA